MYTIRKAYKEDFEKVYPLFQFFDNENISKEQWANLFKPICKELKNDFFGFVLMVDNDYAGFVGCILSQRLISEKKYKICHISSWVLDPKFRGIKSIELMSAILEMDDYIVFDLSPMKSLIPFFTRKLDFKEFTIKYHIVLGIPTIRNVFNKHKLINYKNYKNFLKDTEITLFEDHQLPDVFHVFYRYKSNNIYCIIKPTLYKSYLLNSSPLIRFRSRIWYKLFKKEYFKKQIPLGFVHYTNNPDIFGKSIHHFSYSICKSMKVIGLSINMKYNLKKNFFSFINPNEYPCVYKSVQDINIINFDTLYSEFMLLNINQ